MKTQKTYFNFTHWKIILTMRLKLESALLVSTRSTPTNSQKQNTRIYMLLGKTYIWFLIQNNKNRMRFREKGNDTVRPCIMVFTPVIVKGSAHTWGRTVLQQAHRKRGERKQHLSYSLIYVNSRIETQLFRDIPWGVNTYRRRASWAHSHKQLSVMIIFKHQASQALTSMY